MPRPRSAGSEGSDIDADGLAEQELELQKLNHQYRVLEKERKNYAQEAQDTIKKQRWVYSIVVSCISERVPYSSTHVIGLRLKGTKI